MNKIYLSHNLRYFGDQLYLATHLRDFLLLDLVKQMLSHIGSNIDCFKKSSSFGQPELHVLVIFSRGLTNIRTDAPKKEK